jgi:hypothetical protein
MDFVLLATFLAIVVIATTSGFVGYCMGQESGNSEGYKLGFHDGISGYPPQGSVRQKTHK